MFKEILWALDNYKLDLVTDPHHANSTSFQNTLIFQTPTSEF